MPNKYKYVGPGTGIKTKKNGILIARGFVRVLHGGRGAYIEFSPGQMQGKNLGIMPGEHWRYGTTKVFYHLLQVIGDPSVKVYYQMKTVDYADYKVGMYYVSPIFLQDFVTDGTYEVVSHG